MRAPTPPTTRPKSKPQDNGSRILGFFGGPSKKSPDEPNQLDAPAIAKPVRAPSDREIEALKLIFVESYYHNITAVSPGDVRPIFVHYIEQGLQDDLSPSPLFDVDLVKQSLPVDTDGNCPTVLRWLRSPRRHEIVPTRRFDSEYYESENPDVVASEHTAFDHFIKYGAAEARRPNALFDSEWYTRISPTRHGSAATLPYIHYLTFGLPNGVAPRESLVYAFAEARKFEVDLNELYDTIVSVGSELVKRGGLGAFDLVASTFPYHRARHNPQERSSDTPDLLSDFSVHLQTASFPYQIDEDAFDLLRSMFVPEYYQGLIDAKIADKNLLFAHYLAVGLPEGAPPSPLFDNKVVDRLLPNSRGGPVPVLRWLHAPSRGSVVPTERFDGQYYSKRYPDVSSDASPPYEDYVRYGVHADREPNPIFHIDWYKSASSCTDEGRALPSYYRYLCIDLPRGLAPQRILAPLFHHAGEYNDEFDARFDDLLIAMRPWLRRFGLDKFIILVALYLSYKPKKARGIDDPIADFVGFLTIGAEAGIDPGPLFESQTYLAAATARGHIVSQTSSPLIDFLDIGVHKRIVPTRLFDEESYLRCNPDIKNSGIWAFEHFIIFGIFEGRQGADRKRLSIAPRAQTKRGPLENWLGFWVLHDPNIDRTQERLSKRQATATRILAAAEFSDVVAKAQTLEPLIGDVGQIQDVLFPPIHDGRDVVRSAVVRRLPKPRYDTIICIPWLRTGGADLVACLIAQALGKIRPEEDVLLLQTDQSNVERADWIPKRVDRADISDLLRTVSKRDSEFLLFVTLSSLDPKRIINVNSRLCWEVMARYGTRLSQTMALYSYLFCFDQTENGVKAGYPSQFFPRTAGKLDCTFTDTDYLRHELLQMYRVPHALSARVVTLHSPPREERPTKTGAIGSTPDHKRRPLVLWAGRLDRQKRFDLVQLIAADLPEVDFMCWGKPLLDQEPDMSKSPKNLRLFPSFESFDDLPLGACDVWLYTSSWDGMPTILVELAHRRVAIVASAVGGVPELLDETTGWPIHDVNNVSAYSDAIQSAIAHPGEREARTARLAARAASLYSQAAFCSELATVLDQEAQR